MGLTQYLQWLIRAIAGRVLPKDGSPQPVARPDSPAELEARARRTARGLESEGAAATVVACSSWGDVQFGVSKLATKMVV